MVMKKYKLGTKCRCDSCIEFGKLDWFSVKESMEEFKYYLVDPEGKLSERLYRLTDLVELPFIDISDIEREFDV